MYDPYEDGAEAAVAAEQAEGDEHEDYVDAVVYGPVPEVEA
jgi:hypothetical protein